MKNTIQLMILLLGFLAVWPLNLLMTYFLYKHVEAPQVIWTLWIIQMPLVLVTTTLSEMVKKMKDN